MKRWFDPFVASLLTVMVVGALVAFPAGVQRAAAVVADVAVMALFLVYGMRLPTREVVAGLRDIRLQSAVLASTYLVYPLVAFLAAQAVAPVIGRPFATGLLFLGLLPSTVQMSIAFTSIAGGDTAGAVCAATVSNVLGMVLTPAMVLWFLSAGGGTNGLGGARDVLVKLLVPFVVGQMLESRAGRWVRAHRWLTVGVDRGTVLVVVFGATTKAAAAGVWATVTAWTVLALIAASAVILAVMLNVTWWGGRALALARPQRIALLMCGSKKSLATGLPMANVLFGAAGAVVVPVIVFHQLQMIVCATLARRLAASSGTP